MPKAVIVGGGVAGPAVAQLLTDAGWEAPVFEAREEPDSYAGLFLNVAVNGRRVLAGLGVEGRLLRDAHPAARMVMWGARGQRLGEVANGPVGRPEDGGVVVRRAWLHDVVWAGAERAGVRTHAGRRLVAVHEGSGSVAATFADGHVEEGDVLVGADGVGSQAREHVAPEVRPEFTGLVGTGGFARVLGLAPTPGRQHFVFGRRSFFGYLVRDDGTAYWFANATADTPPGPERSTSWRDRLADLHRDDPSPVPEILARTSGELRGYPIFRLPSVPRWSRGRVVLAGDAVHATSPSAGQGASLALEDAAVLAAALREHPDPTTAFAAYESARRGRAEAVVAYAAGIDQQKRAPGSRIGAAIRDAVLPIFLRRAAGDTRDDWVYDFTPPA